MHRLALLFGAVWIAAGPGMLHAQPPWPADPAHSTAAASSSAAPPAPSRRITPRDGRAEPEQPAVPSAARRAPSPWTAFVSLGVIVAVIVVGSRLWKKHGPPLRLGLPSEALEILGKRQLDRRHAIQMIRCGSRILILGVSDEGLRTLAEITDPVEVDYFAGVCRRSDPVQDVGQSFLSLFQRSQETIAADELGEIRGRVDRVLAERFTQSASPSGSQGSAAHA